MKDHEKMKGGMLPKGRRVFLQKMGALAVMSSFGMSFFASCSSEEDMGPDQDQNLGNGINVTEEKVTIDLEKQNQLKSAGGWILLLEARMLVVNVDGNSFSALTSVCTHSGCDRNWALNQNQFICSCHGSRFDLQGNVLNGPATRPLSTFATKIEGNVLVVTR
ncbi:ubiquinol-cytochrome c reductase iron-sulfur subunit [Cecembia rubra]|uniref:Cytochrome b6-f complex iron-sulfur subunit n=1 Tax=Cecembia rubra TaxID=1485585 RepID=A0A2P8E1N2_9BACT|nr:Rieske (2Fe-2S) protein [Cecembia rubra]PSL03366.1 cytochrome b6-f complex iron-sulfur subunit [Cecembia rubra]